MRSLSILVGCLGVAIGAVFAGCGSDDIGALEAGPGDGDANGANDAGGTGFGPGGDEDGGREGGPRPIDDSHEAYCAGEGPPLLTVPDAGTIDTCDLAKKTFRYAMCSCEGFVGSDALTTDAFDSTAGAYDPAAPLLGGSVGSNGNFSSSGPVDIGGSLWVSSTSGLTLGAAAQARSELHSAGNTSTGPTFTVGRSAWVAESWTANGDLTIGGTLTIPTGKTLSVGGTSTIASTVRAPVSVPPACDCAPSLMLDVANVVESTRLKNDNTAMGIAANAFASVQTATTAQIPCGRLFLTGITTSAPLTLELNGRTAIFVAGDVSLQADFRVVVPPGAELDLFIAGNVVAAAGFSLGDQTTPAKARAYVGGTGTVNLGQASTLAGNVYAPRAEAVLADGATIYGSIFARRVAAGGALTIHFDESIVTKGEACPAPPTCDSCHDCGGQACIGGQCGACGSSADCCPPLVCRSGSCVPSVK